MKKTICVVLALVMALGCVSAWAEDVTGDEIDAHAPLSKVMEIVHAIEAAADEGKKTETVGGPADDRKENPLEKEYNEQKGKNV